MKSFAISQAQIAQIIGAASADEVSRVFNRDFDFLAIASWNAETPLGAGGLDLCQEEIDVCGRRVAALFGLEPNFLEGVDAKIIADWAAAISVGISGKLEWFMFKSAARDDSQATRTHRADEIFQDAAAAANIFHGRRRLLSFVAPHGLLGFVFTILTPNLQRIESIDARDMMPETLSKTLSFGDVLIATPTLWRYMMREKLTAPDNTMAVAFGEPMTPELAAQMREAGFGVMREVYGSTETGLIGWRDAPNENFVLFDHWRRDGDKLMRVAPDAAAREVEPMDFIEWADDRSFSLSGRRDGAVQIGAVNVFPKDVTERLRTHPHIADCRIRVDRRADGVDRLIAHILLNDELKPDMRTVRDIDLWCRTSLRRQERPCIYHFEASLADA